MANYHQMPASRLVGDYILSRELGKGAFSVVWLGRHRVRGIDVAVKEIIMDKLTKKLKESLLSEVHILRQINHPNIISLYDSINGRDRIYLILEYCRGGDLSMYIQRHGRAPEATAKHFMRQLASGLQVLRDNNVVHRDLKPQNILLSSNDESAVLKIADFGFAKSLQPDSMTETLCGSPLYMAPEVLQVQRYNAKADLWSIGVILYQLVTGHTPYNGGNQIQLLQNIKSTEVRFPPGVNLSNDCIDLCRKLLKRNPVERLTMDEFLNHQFLIDHNSDGSLSRTSSDGFPLVGSSPARPSGQSSHDDCMPFAIDDEPTAQNEGPFNHPSPSSRFPFPSNLGKSPDLGQPSKHTGFVTKYGGFEATKPETQRPGTSSSAKAAVDTAAGVIDSTELLEGYVVVSGPHADSPSSSLTNADRREREVSLSLSPPSASPKLTAPMPIHGALNARTRSTGRIESPNSGNSQGSNEMGEAIDKPSSDYMIRIKSLQQCASAISDLVKHEVSLASENSGKYLRAFSVQLVLLAIWKQAMQICHKVSAASAVIPSRERRSRSKPGSYNSSFSESEQADSLRARIEREFLLEVSRAEELASFIAQISETTEMPDAIEIIFQAALTSGRDGGVDEMMGNAESAVAMYSKAGSLLKFLLVEAPLVDLNPPFSLTKCDRYRLRSYIDALNNRLAQLHSIRHPQLLH